MLKNIKPLGEECVFCSDHFKKEEFISQWPSEGHWGVVRLKNIFPIINKRGATNEIIVPTPIHSATFGSLSIENTMQYFFMMARSVARSSKKMSYTSVFTNEGPGGGASKSHLHTQIVGMDFVPNIISELSNLSKANCHFCSFTSGNYGYKIAEQGFFAAFVPNDAKNYYQIKIIGPHVQGIQHLNLSQFEDLAKIFIKCQKALESCVEYPSMNILYRSGPHDGRDYHFHIDIIPRLNFAGGFEYDTGVVVLSSYPRAWARDLKAAIKKQK
ncbi:MAG: hypothetical protein WC492_04305 [Candidatus Micrarchaeia archaeon]